MENKDYFMREIEKIGTVLRAIINSLTGKKENLAITLENPFEETRELLYNETGFDLGKFLIMDEAASGDYIAQFKGINAENLELLAEITFQSGMSGAYETRKVFLEKALQLYEFSNRKDKTFSIERENKMEMIRKAL